METNRVEKLSISDDDDDDCIQSCHRLGSVLRITLFPFTFLIANQPVPAETSILYYIFPRTDIIILYFVIIYFSYTILQVYCTFRKMAFNIRILLFFIMHGLAVDAEIENDFYSRKPYNKATIRAIRKITNFLNELRKFFFPSKPNVNVIWSPFVLIYIYIFIGAANEVLKQFYTNSTQQIW